MRSSSKREIRVGLFAVLAATAGGAEASPDSLLDIPLEQLGTIEITTAAKVSEPLAKTAATVSVVGAAEIRRMGARTLSDILERLPGLAVGGVQYGDNFIAIRGLRSTWSEKVLLLLDGHLINDARSGSATFQFLDSLPVDNIARIEVVRGPGSALYGANAFLGIINIITQHSAEAARELEVAVSGEFEPAGTVARRYNLRAAGGRAGEWGGHLNANFLNSPGAELRVDEDAFGRRGVADNHVDRLDVQGGLEMGPFALHGHYLRREAGDGFGGLAVLNDESSQHVDYLFVDAEYRVTPAPATDLSVRAYVDQQKTDNYYEVPAGMIPSGSFFFPWNGTGFVADLLAQETIQGAEARLDYRGIAAHTLTAGLAWRFEKLHDVRHIANYDPSPLPQVIDVSGYYNWIEPASRNISSLYLQDLWDIRADVRATLGARYDHYDDFGGTFNPRIGVVWQATTELAARLSFGSAFRAPAFFEQHVQNNPGQQGNTDLDPEEIDTWEAGLQWQRGPAQAGVTLFRSAMHNLIDIAAGSTQFHNLGKAAVRGVELEGRYRLRAGPEIAANYSYADPEYSVLEPRVRTPLHHLNFIADTTIAAEWHWNLHAYGQSETARADGDPRAAVDSVWLLNTALTFQHAPWEINAALFNATDAEHAVSAPAGTLPGDFTAPGRSLVLGIRYGL